LKARNAPRREHRRTQELQAASCACVSRASARISAASASRACCGLSTQLRETDPPHVCKDRRARHPHLGGRSDTRGSSVSASDSATPCSGLLADDLRRVEVLLAVSLEDRRQCLLLATRSVSECMCLLRLAACAAACALAGVCPTPYMPRAAEQADRSQ